MPIIKKNENLYLLDKKKVSASAQRKMAAIFAADVVGYSKLMASNEKLTLFRLKETRKLTDRIINELHGRIFSTAGDSIMAEFASPVDAVEAAINIQKEVNESMSAIKDDVKIEFRVGINLGDIMIQDENLYGDNVNIAARLESIAEPGQICVSEKVYLEINNKVDTKFRYIGEKRLKNISQKIKTYSSKLGVSEDENNSNKLSKNKIIIIAASFIVLLPVIYLIYDNFFSTKITYTDNSKSVLENFRTSQSGIDTGSNFADDGKLVIALMSFQNQTSNLSNIYIENLSNVVKNSLSDSENIRVTASPGGAENLNPPEVMLIATESEASFVINGIVFSEDSKNILSIKIYEAKRGSIITNEKIILSEDGKNQSLIKFFSTFKDDIIE